VESLAAYGHGCGGIGSGFRERPAADERVSSGIVVGCLSLSLGPTL